MKALLARRLQPKESSVSFHHDDHAHDDDDDHAHDDDDDHAHDDDDSTDHGDDFLDGAGKGDMMKVVAEVYIENSFFEMM